MSASLSDGDRAAYRWGGLAGIALAFCYIAITVLFVVSGPIPHDADAWLAYLAPKVALWWAIALLSVLTDVLFLPLAYALYIALRSRHRATAMVGATLIALFVVLDLAVTWPNYAALIALSGENITAEAAAYPVAVLQSPLFAVYAILVPALGIAAFGWAMRRGPFGRIASYLGIIIGLFGIVAGLGPVVIGALGTAAILTSVLTIVWVFMVSVRLVRLLPS